MKKRWISRMTALLLCLALAAGVLPGTARAAEAVSYIECSWDGTQVVQTEKTVSEYTAVTTGTTTWNSGWYVVSGEVAFSDKIIASGDVHLILTDGAVLTANSGIIVNSGNSLSIYAQSTGTGMGKLKAIGQSSGELVWDQSAGIGGEYGQTAGTITIHGGRIEAEASYQGGAAIGGGRGGDNGTVSIYGGNVTATGKYKAAGIGGGNVGNGGNVNIYGGTVNAIGNTYTAGIGGGMSGSAGTVNIHGGTVTATGGIEGAGIGSGVDGEGGTVTITGGTVTAKGAREGAGIGGCEDADGVDVIITGGTVTATGGECAAGIGGGNLGAGGTVTITGGTVTATGGEHGAGIGGGLSGAGGTVTITGGTVTATGGKYGAGIGGGDLVAGGTVTITGGNVKAVAGKGAQAIGKGRNGSGNGTLTDGKGNNVSLRTLTLEGVTEQAAVTGISGTDYGVNDVKTLDTNKLYFYLPSDANVTAVTAGDTGYICNRSNTLHTAHSGFDGDGFCTVCGDYESAAKNDGGVYEIDNAGKLFWLAEQIRGGSFGKFHAKLTADITIPEGKTWTAAAVPEDHGNVLDGDGHSIHMGEQTCGLFVNFNYATVKNLRLYGSITADGGSVGAIAASAYRTRIENVISYVDVTNTNGDAGGLVGNYGGKHADGKESKIINCAVYADISGTNAGGLVATGWNGTQYYDIYNCAYVGNVTGSTAGAIVGYQATDSNTSTFNTVYWCEPDGLGFYGKRDTTNQKYINTEAKSAEAFASGEVAYLLGEAWGQAIGEDELPVLSGKKVNCGYTTCGAAQPEPIYTNDPVTAEKPGHTPNEDDGDCTTKVICGFCGDTTTEAMESHTPGKDDGDCTTPIPCTQCEQMAVAGKTHNFEYGECANDGCNVRQTFTMTYYVDGVQVHQETYTCGSAYYLWTPEEKDGLTFLGWAETEGGEVKYPDWEYIWPAEDLTFHAVYGTVYTVRYYSYDAEQDSYFDNGTATVVAGDTLTLGEQFSYWYKCVGWATEEKGRMVYTVGQEITPTGDLKLYSVVEPFSAQVELGAEDAVYDRTVISGELPYSGVILTSFPTRPGYVFTGWLDEDGMFHEPFENEEGVRCIEIIFGKDTTLTAQWELCTHTPGEDGKCANCGMAVVTVKELPETVEAEIGEKAAVTVEATGKNLTYTWYFANPGKDTFSVTTAFIGPEYSVAMSESRNGRRIYCLVTDENGFFAKTNIVTLCLPRNELAIVTQPVDVTAAEGEKATVTFEATGDGLAYTWYYANPGKDTFSKTTSFTSNTYEVTMSTARSGRRVYCVVTDKYGNAVQTDTVTLFMPMNVAAIVSQSKSVWVPEGEKAVVTVEATGDGLTYKWYYKNPGASKYTYTDSFKGNTYSVTMTEARSGRYVYCKVTDKYGNTVKSKTVSVNMQTPLEIVTQPKSVKVAEGEKATVTVEAQGDGLTYKWYYKDPGGTKYKYTDSFKSNTYSITMSDARSGRYVFCRVYDKYGNMVKTNTVSLRMK